MSKKIELNNILQSRDKENIVIKFQLKINDKSYTLEYKINTINSKLFFPLYESFDCVVVTFLLHAMMYGYDFYSNYPISEKLYYNLTYNIIPQLKKVNSKLHHTLINAPITKFKSKNKLVATGISCGIDSLTTIYEYSQLCEMEDYKLTHLVYFKAGAHDGQLGRYDKITENKLFASQLENAKNFCINNKYPLIIVDSNLNEIMSTVFGFTSYDRTHTLRNCGIMYLFQKDFAKYYYADTYGLDNFSINIYEDIAHYEKYLLPLLSNENIEFYSANKGMSRFEKTKLLTNFSQSYDNLLVCWMNGKNCGICDKCIRTMVTLDILGKLDKYEKSFDVDNYLKNRKKYISKVIALKNVDPFFHDIYLHMDNKFKMKKSVFYYILYKFYALYKRVRKFGKKIIVYK